VCPTATGFPPGVELGVDVPPVLQAIGKGAGMGQGYPQPAAGKGAAEGAEGGERNRLGGEHRRAGRSEGP